MRSKIAQRILSETPQSVREFVKKYGESIINNGNMKVKLILLTEPILVSDEEIKEGDWVYNAIANKKYTVNEGLAEVLKGNSLDAKCHIKIIAGIPELPSIDFSALSEEDCKKIGWVDVEKLANESFPVSIFDDLFEEGGRIGFKEGFKAYQSLNEKKFSEEDIIKAYEAGEDAGYVRGSDGRDDSKFLSIEELLQSLSQPKVFDVEVEMKLKEPYKDQYGDLRTNDFEPKITNNSIKVIKVL